MIDILTIQVGDIVEYENYLCSESLRDERFYGVYQGFTYWSPDERPIELWIELIGQSERTKGLKIRVRASQVTHVTRAQGHPD